LTRAAPKSDSAKGKRAALGPRENFAIFLIEAVQASAPVEVLVGQLWRAAAGMALLTADTVRVNATGHMLL